MALRSVCHRIQVSFQIHPKATILTGDSLINAVAKASVAVCRLINSVWTEGTMF